MPAIISKLLSSAETSRWRVVLANYNQMTNVEVFHQPGTVDTCPRSVRQMCTQSRRAIRRPTTRTGAKRRRSLTTLVNELVSATWPSVIACSVVVS